MWPRLGKKTLAANYIPHQGGRKLEQVRGTSRGRPAASSSWARGWARLGPSRSQEVCADRREDSLLDIGADQQQHVHISHAQGRPSPPATESGVLQSRCITPYAPHVLVVYLVTHHLSTYLLRPMVRASVTHHGSGASSLTARAAMRVRMLEAATSPTPLPHWRRARDAASARHWPA